MVGVCNKDTRAETEAISFEGLGAAILNGHSAELRAVSDGGGCAAHDRARSVQVPEQDGTAPWGKGDVS